MKITNATLTLRDGGGTWLERLGRELANCTQGGRYPLRVAIVQVTGREALAEVTFVETHSGDPHRERFTSCEIAAPRRKLQQAERFAVVQVVPTGIRCEIGGFAGDACPATNLLASSADILITHPNAVNASDLNEMAENVLYVEGKSLDDFLLGHLGLSPTAANRIGTFIDPAGLSFLDDLIHTLNAARAVGGIDCGIYHIAAQDLGVRTVWSPSGCAVGTVDNPLAILASAAELLAAGAQALGGVSVIHGVTASEFTRHLAGHLPNPSGGIEAIITHLISKVFRVPTAHAPLPYYQGVKERGTHNPRAAAEFISTPHYFSVLKGLRRAPRLQEISSLTQSAAHLLTLNNVGAIVMPASCLGGLPALVAQYSDIPLIAVEDNRTLLQVSNTEMRMRNVIAVRSYLEAAGAILALRRGLSLESLRRPLTCAVRIGSEPDAQEACA